MQYMYMYIMKKVTVKLSVFLFSELFMIQPTNNLTTKSCLQFVWGFFMLSVLHFLLITIS